jgi:CheY-like chemotaxis protein
MGRRTVPGARPGESSEGPLILIVEDDRNIALLIEKNLEAAGFRAHSLHQGTGVVEAIEDLAPALVVLDVMLPGMDGLEITRRIRSAQNPIPILMAAPRAPDSGSRSCVRSSSATGAASWPKMRRAPGPCSASRFPPQASPPTTEPRRARSRQDPT